MTDEEAIAACLAGQRVVTDTTLSAFDIEPKACVRHNWRTVACDGGQKDVGECSRCGVQRILRCNLDEDYQ